MRILSKLLVKKFTISLSLLTLFLFSNTTIATPPDYLGNYCFSLNQTYPPSDAKIVNIKLGVTHTGDAYYQLEGTSQVRPGDDFPLIGAGTAVVIGNNVLVTLNGTYSNKLESTVSTQSIQMQLDMALNGDFWGIETGYDKTNGDRSIFYYSGTATLVPCQ